MCCPLHSLMVLPEACLGQHDSNKPIVLHPPDVALTNSEQSTRLNMWAGKCLAWVLSGNCLACSSSLQCMLLVGIGKPFFTASGQTGVTSHAWLR